MAEYSTELKKRGAFVLNLSIRRIVAKSNKFLADDDKVKVKIEIQFDGNYKIKSTDVDEVLTDPYVESRNIKSIKIDGFTQQKQVFIDLGVTYGGAMPVSMTLTGNHDGIIATRNNIEETIDGGKQWYSLLIFPQNFLSVITYYIFLVPIATAAFIFLIASCFHLNIISANAFYLIPIWIALTIIVFSMKKRMFPKMAFAFGRSANLINQSKWWRNVVGVVVISGLTIGVTSKIIAEPVLKYLFGH